MNSTVVWLYHFLPNKISRLQHAVAQFMKISQGQSIPINNKNIIDMLVFFCFFILMNSRRGYSYVFIRRG